MAIHGERRKRLVPLENEVDGLPGGHEGRIVQRSLGKDGRIAGGDQDRIALAQRHAQPFGQMQQQVAAGCRAPAFDEAQVPLRDFRVERQVELAQMAATPPFAQDVTEALGGHAAAGTLSRKPLTSLSRPSSTTAKSVPLIISSLSAGPSFQEKRRRSP